MSTLLPLLTDYEKTQLAERQPLPERYIGLSDEEMDRRIAAARAQLGRRLVILGHHYQRDEVIKFADYTGDSYKLAHQVAKHPDAEFIVFCGVHFMAESADVLSADHQQVILPDLAAGCSMSDMAEPEQLEMCWRELHQLLGVSDVAADPPVGPNTAGLLGVSDVAADPPVGPNTAGLLGVPDVVADLEVGPNTAGLLGVPDVVADLQVGPKNAGLKTGNYVAHAVPAPPAAPAPPAHPALRAPVIPVTYINSAAGIKAFCGEHGGVVCTSSNAAATLKWAWERGDKILFLPDQHLGRNTAYKMGVPLDQMVVWDPNEVDGGLDADAVKRARIILWKGHCSVHTRFTVRQIEQIRAQHPGVRVIVHPEVPWEVVQAADDSGSTEYIIRQVTAGPVGSVWAVGTEIHLVSRLAEQVAPERTVISIDQFGCLCSTMFRVSPNHLLWILEGLLEGEVHNRIVVPPDQKYWTKVALDRMLSIS